MKQQLLKGLFIAGLVCTSAPALAASNGLPSFGFEQEFAGVTPNGDIRADIYQGGAGAPYSLRVGAFGGEVMIDPTIASVNATGIGYKGNFNRNMAAYGKLYLNTGGGTSTTNITLGFAYTGTSGRLLYNGNAEVFSCSNCATGNTSQSVFNLKGAAFYTIHTTKLAGKTSLGAEVNLQLSPSPSTTSIFLGARWEPKPSVLIDIGVASSVQTGGTTANTFATPAFVRLNLGL
jgi:hypothetical protein